VALIWKPHYTTGVKTLDRQHQKIFDLVNRLGELVTAGNPDPDVLDKLFMDMDLHIRTHFTQEERCMARRHCPMAERNKQEHDEFLTFYEQFLSDYRNTRSLKALKTFHRKAEWWLLEHVCFIDIHLRSCVQKTQQS